MNRHFEDTRYYLKRAGQEARRGVADELAPLVERVEQLFGEEEPDPSRIEKVQAELKELQAKAEGEAKGAIGEARAKLPGSRSR
jgi:predicted  nucleic acid-binding Zn-ribbon protein